MSRLIRSLATWQGRFLSGAACMVAVGIAVASAQNSGLSLWAKLGLAAPVLPTILTWTVATISGGNAAHPHDVRLFEHIMSTVSSGERDFLRTHDFGNDFQLSSLYGIREIRRWHGAPHEFLDEGLQKRWRTLKSQIDCLCELIVRDTAPVHGSVRYQTVYPRTVDREDPPPKVIAEIQALNAAATTVWEGLNAFEPVARRKLFV